MRLLTSIIHHIGRHLVMWTINLMLLLAIDVVALREGNASALYLTLQDAPISITRDQTVTKKLIGIPRALPGKISFYIKWHDVAILESYSMLNIDLLHGSNLMTSFNCYSGHAPWYLKPVCRGNEYLITAEESKKDLEWKIRVRNNGYKDITGFNVLKEITDINPLVPDLRTGFEPDCSAVKIYISSPGLTVSRNTTSETSLRLRPAPDGVITFKAKWHTPPATPLLPLPNYQKLTLTLLNELGTIVKYATCFSYHSPETPKCDFKIAAGLNYWEPRKWTLRIKNEGSLDISGFNIEKGDDLNPLVPSFISTFKPNCP